MASTHSIPIRQVLRPYQSDAIEGLRREIRAGYRSILLVAPTGAGKTSIAAAMIESAVGRGKRIVFLAHRKELIEQCSERLDGLGVGHGIIQANHWRRRAYEMVHVASVQTLVNRELNVPPDILFIDECHRARSASYIKIRQQYPSAILIGLTATPIRTDGRGLGSLFQRMVECPSVRELTELGHLVPTRVYAPSRPDLTGVQSSGGDYKAGQLQHAMDRPKITGDVVQHWLKLGEDRQTILFAAGVEASKHLAEAFRAAGVNAVHLDGGSDPDERTRTLCVFRAGEARIMCNVGLFTEGFDCPSASCVILVAPTQSLGKYLQMCGRGLRPHPGKIDELILDHAGCTLAHGFVDDDRQWELTEDRMQAQKLAIDTSLGIKCCPKCFRVFPATVRVCQCGYKFHFVERAGPLVVAGDLVEVGEDARRKRYEAIPDDKRRTLYMRWAQEAVEHGWKPGYPDAKYKAMYGRWPEAALKRESVILRATQGELV